MSPEAPAPPSGVRDPEGGLRAIQERFYGLVVAPEGVAPGLEQGGLTASDLERIVVGDARLSAVARLDIYANMYFFRLRDVLRDDYEKIVAVVGDPAFHDLVVEYLVACPPTHGSIREAGARLPEFLRAHPLSVARPWLCDLARLERARIEAWDGFPDAAPLLLESLRTLPPEAFAALPLRPVPAHLVLACDHAVAAVWTALEHRRPAEGSGEGDGEEEDVPHPVAVAVAAAEPGTLLVWRQGVEVFHRSIDAVEAEALALAIRGEPFGVLCEALARRLGDEEATRVAFELLGRWVGDHLIAA